MEIKRGAEFLVAKLVLHDQGFCSGKQHQYSLAGFLHNHGKRRFNCDLGGLNVTFLNDARATCLLMLTGSFCVFWFSMVPSCNIRS